LEASGSAACRSFTGGAESSSGYIPQEARMRGSAAPIQVLTTTSARRSAAVAATWQAQTLSRTAVVAAFRFLELGTLLYILPASLASSTLREASGFLSIATSRV